MLPKLGLTVHYSARLSDGCGLGMQQNMGLTADNTSILNGKELLVCLEPVAQWRGVHRLKGVRVCEKRLRPPAPLQRLYVKPQLHRNSSQGKRSFLVVWRQMTIVTAVCKCLRERKISAHSSLINVHVPWPNPTSNRMKVPPLTKRVFEQWSKHQGTNFRVS